MKKTALVNWLFSDEKLKQGWLPAAVPGTVHTDLLNNKIIPEPFKDDNELKLQWIYETGWIYKTEFDYPTEFSKNKPAYLSFEGIDTIASVLLNGRNILKADNMFLKYEADVTKLLKEKKNELKVAFKSPVKHAAAEEAKHGKLPVALNSERVYIRKAQYSFGWDWGPSFPTSGLWRPVYLLQKGEAFIKDVYFETKSLTKQQAGVLVKFKAGRTGNLKGLRFSAMLYYDSEVFGTVGRLSGKEWEQVVLKINNPKLWNPAGEGEPNLYRLEIKIFDADKNEIDSVTKKVGIRTIELQLKDKGKNTFRFIVNGKTVYAKGTNWIPSDSFIPRATREKYFSLLKAARDGNQNIVRVWGGGFYENDEFYEICDELGLMVWHDFMFACGAYPGHKDFLDNVAAEITFNVNRLQHHPCIILWCGNNENEWIWHQERKSSYKEMPGYEIFSSLIPKILKKEDSSRPYWESSPFGFDDDPNSPKSGNRHQWNIWSMWTDYREVVNDSSLFVTEFGFQGPANRTTLEKFISPEQRNIQSRIFEFHNKQVEGNERLIRFLAGHLPLNTGWEDFIYLAQLNQGLALKTCLEHWQRNSHETNGSIIWQLNDCWPVTSWALIDSELKPKLAYYFVKNAFAPLFISIAEEKGGAVIHLHNRRAVGFEGVLEIKKFAAESGKPVSGDNAAIKIKPGGKTKYKTAPAETGEIIVASVYSQEQRILARNCIAGSEWKYLKLNNAIIKRRVREINKNQCEVILRTDLPAYFADPEHPELIFSDRGFILLPGEEKKITAQKISGGLINADEIEIKTLNQYLLQ
jgi:beta-mannosidase